MCAINPKRQLTFTLTAYTSHDLDEATWLALVMERALNVEQLLNLDGRVRWHLTQEQTNV